MAALAPPTLDDSQAPASAPPAPAPTGAQIPKAPPTGPAEISLSLGAPRLPEKPKPAAAEGSAATPPPAAPEGLGATQTPPSAVAPPQAAPVRALTTDELSGATPAGQRPSNVRDLTPDETSQMNPADAAVRAFAATVQDRQHDYFNEMIKTGALFAGAAAGPEVLGLEAAPALSELLSSPIGKGILLAKRAGAAFFGAGAAHAGAKEALGEEPSLSETATQAAPMALGEAAAPAVRAAVFDPLEALLTRTPMFRAPFAAKSAEYLRKTYGGPPVPGVELTPAQAYPGPLQRITELIGRLSLLGEKPYAARDAMNESVINQKADSLIQQYGQPVSNEEAGATLRGAAVTQARNQAQRDLADTVLGAGHAADEPMTAHATGTAAKNAAVATAGQTAAEAEANVGRAQTAVTNRTNALRAQSDRALGRETTGNMVQAALGEAEGAARDTGKQLYAAVDQMAGGAPVVSLERLTDTAHGVLDTTGVTPTKIIGGKGEKTAGNIIRATAPPTEEETAEAAGGPVHAPNIGGIRPTDPRYARFAQDILRNEGASLDPQMAASLRMALQDAHVSPEDFDAGHITFMQAHRMRSTFGQLQAAALRSADNNAPGAAVYARQLGQFHDAMDQAMEEASGGPDSPLWDAYQQASSHWKNNVAIFYKGILSKVASVEPNAFLRSLFQPGRVNAIRQVYGLITPEAQDALKAQFLRNLMFAPDGVTPLADKQVLANIKKWPVETLGAIFDKPTVSQLTDLDPAMAKLDQATEARDAAQAGVKQAAGMKVPPPPKPSPAPARVAAAGARAIDQVASQRAADLLGRVLPGGSVEDAVKMRQLVGPADWRAVQSAHLQQFLYDDAGNLRSPKQLAAMLGPEKIPALEAIHDVDTVNDLKSIQRSLAMISPTFSRKFGFGVKMGQATAMAAMARGVFGMTSAEQAATAAAALGGPAVLSRIVMNTAARKWLTTGLEASTAGKVGLATRAFSQLTTWLLAQGLIDSTGAAPPPPKAQGAAPAAAASPSPGGRAGGAPPTPVQAPPPPSLGVGRGGG